jgi:dTDP-4-amino-4,6-dideoxygalactose transaminase
LIEPRFALPRRHALLGGTTRLPDVLAAANMLVRPWALVDGAATPAFESAFAAAVGAAHAKSFAAGRVGLYAILRCLGIGRGDEVLLQVPTHIVVPNAIRFAGARPVYIDCDLRNYNIDLDEVESRITPRTRALLLQHTFGVPVDMHAAMDLAQRHGLTVIEDCVHALGSTFAGRTVGTFGQAAFFSTEETKTISTTMGGVVTTDDAELADRLAAFQRDCLPARASQTARYLVKLIAYHVLTEPRIHVAARSAYEMAGHRHPLPRPTEERELRGERPSGFARRLSNGQAAVGVVQLGDLARNVAHRRRIADRYRQLLAPHGFRLPEPPAGADAAYVRYPVWVADRRATEEAMSSRLVLGTWFTSVLEEAIDPRYGAYAAGSCPRAEEAARHLVNLPTHPRVSLRDADDIAERLIGFANPAA